MLRRSRIEKEEPDHAFGAGFGEEIDAEAADAIAAFADIGDDDEDDDDESAVGVGADSVDVADGSDGSDGSDPVDDGPAAADEVVESTEPVSLQGLRLLVVNDDPHSCELISRLVESLGCRARRVNSPDGVVEFLSDPNNEIGGVILDVRAGVNASVPVLEGIRSLESRAGNLPVIVLTSTSDDADPVWGAGGDAFMARPFHADDFLREMETVLTLSPADRVKLRATRS